VAYALHPMVLRYQRSSLSCIRVHPNHLHRFTLSPRVAAVFMTWKVLGEDKKNNRRVPTCRLGLEVQAYVDTNIVC